MTQATVDQLYADCRQRGIDEARWWKLLYPQPVSEQRIKAEMGKFALSVAFALGAMGRVVQRPIETDPDVVACLAEIEAAFRAELASESPPPYFLSGTPDDYKERVPNIKRLRREAADVGDACGRVLFQSTAGCATEADFEKEDADFAVFFADDEILAATAGDRAQIQILKLAFGAAIRAGYAALAIKENR